MGALERRHTETRPKAVSSTLERLIREHFGGGATSSGVSVSNDTAMRQATVYSCVNILQRVFGMLPCHMMKQSGEKSDKARDFYLYPLLHDMPNEWMTSQEFWGMKMAHCALRGNFFALKNRGLSRDGRPSLNGPVRELIPLAPGVVKEVVQQPNYKLVYKCKFPDGSDHDIPSDQMMHLRGMVLNGFMGVNPIEYIRESVALGLASEEFGARYFGSGTHPGMIVEYPNKLDKQTHDNLQGSLSEAYSGLGKAHRLLLLEDGMKAQKITIDPKDAQFLELRKFQKSEIVDIFFGLPLTVMNSGDNTPTYASAEQFSIGWVVYALMPWIVNAEKGIYRDLLSPKERESYYAKFQVRGLQRGSFKEQMEAFAIAIDKEIFNPNECRELLDMNPYAGGEEYRTRTSTVKQQPGPSKDEGASQ